MYIHMSSAQYFAHEWRTSTGGPESLQTTPNLPTNIVDFRGLDSSRLLILRGGNSHVR